MYGTELISPEEILKLDDVRLVVLLQRITILIGRTTPGSRRYNTLLRNQRTVGDLILERMREGRDLLTGPIRVVESEPEPEVEEPEPEVG